MRRTFLTATLSLAAATLVFGQGGAKTQSRQSGDDALVTHYLIVIDGKPAGWAQPPVQKPARGLIVPSQTKIIIIAASAGMSKDFYDWIRASFNGKHVTKSGVVNACNVKYESMSIRKFTDAVVSEVTFPALDGSSKEPAYMKIKLSPERITYKKGDGKKVKGTVGAATRKWQASNFRVEIGDLPCTRVAKIDSFTWKQGVTPRTGETQNLKLTLPMSDWDAWASAAKSQAGRPAAKKGTLTVSGRYAKSGYVLSFTGINIVKLTRETQSANAKRIAWFVVELHVNEIDLDFVRR